MPRSRCCFCVLYAVFATAQALGLLFLIPRHAGAAEPAAAKDAISFINDVAPILKENCFACHGSKSPKGKLDMTRYETFRKGGTKDDPIMPGKPEESLLIDLVTATDKTRMPPRESGDALPSAKIAVIQRWIKEGANLDAGVAPTTDLYRELRARRTSPPPDAAYRFAEPITALAFTPDNKKVVVGGHHELTVWDLALGTLEKRIYTRCERARAMLFLPDGKLAVAGGWPGQEGDVKIYDLEGGTPRTENGVVILDGVNDKGVMLKQLLEADDEVWCLALSHDGAKLAAGGSDRMAYVWDLSSGYADAKVEQTIENHADWVLGVTFSADGKYLLTASRDKTAKVWDLAAKESVLTFPDHQAAVYGVAIKPDGKLAISVGEDRQVRLWKPAPETKQQLRSLSGHNDAVLRVLVHPTQPLVITCSNDKTVRIWNIDSAASVRTLSGHTDCVFALALSPSGQLIASGSYNGEVRIWKLSDGSLVKAFSGSPGLQQAAK